MINNKTSSPSHSRSPQMISRVSTSVFKFGDPKEAFLYNFLLLYYKIIWTVLDTEKPICLFNLCTKLWLPLTSHPSTL